MRSPSLLLRDPWTVLPAAAAVALALVHYTTHGSDVTHAVVRRLAYLPIAVLAVRHGVRGGLLAGAFTAVSYLPHAFLAEDVGHWLGVHIHPDPSPSVEKVSELVLYLGLGALVGAAVDAARRTRAELGAVRQDLVRTTEELRRAERLGALGELTAGIAHEVRNPLTSLRSTAEILAEAYPEGHRRHRMAALHLSEIDRLDGVVQKFLDFARPKPPSTAPVQVDRLLERTQELLAATGREHGVQVRTGAVQREGSGEPAPSASIDVDEDLMVQVLLNLGLNAVQHSAKDSEVVLDARVGEQSVRLRVTDRGPGVSPELGERIFDPCVTSRPEGSGLGLSVASRLVEAHGGRLTFEPNPAGGTVFLVTLPRAL